MYIFEDAVLSIVLEPLFSACLGPKDFLFCGECLNVHM